MLTKP